MSISPIGPRGVNLDADATTQPAASTGDTAATSGARATRIPTSIRPPIPGPLPPFPGAARWGGPQTLGTDLERALDGGEFAEVKEMMRTAVAIANSRSLERGPMIKALNDTIESLARQGKLDGLIEAFQMTPDLMNLQPVSTLVKGFLDVNGTDAAKRAWNEESLAAQKPSAQNLTRDLSEATNLGQDSLVSMHGRRLVDLFPAGGAPSADAKKTLDGTITALAQKGVLDDALLAMQREADEFIRTHPNVRLYPLHRQIHDLVEAHGSPQTKRFLADAERLAAANASPSGTEIAQRLEGAIGQSSDREVSQLAQEWLRAPADSPKRIAIMNEAVVALSRGGKLDDFYRAVVRESEESYAALMRRNPGIRIRWYPVERQIADAIARSGSPEVKTAWSRMERGVGNPSGYERAADIAAALRGGEDNEVGTGAHQLLDLVNTSPPTRPRAEDLNAAVLTLSYHGQLDDFVAALKRNDAKAARNAPPNVRIASTLSLFNAAVDRFGSPAAKRAWAAANR